MLDNEGSINSLSVIFSKSMNVPVKTGAPRILTSFTHLVKEVVSSFLFCSSKMEGITNVIEILDRSKLGDTGGQHDGKKTDEKCTLLTEYQKCLFTQTLESIRLIQFLSFSIHFSTFTNSLLMYIDIKLYS